MNKPSIKLLVLVVMIFWLILLVGFVIGFNCGNKNISKQFSAAISDCSTSIVGPFLLVPDKQCSVNSPVMYINIADARRIPLDIKGIKDIKTRKLMFKYSNW